MRLGAAVTPLACLALGCGRLDFTAANDVDARAGDPTICDELTGALLCEGWEGTRQLATDSATLPDYVTVDGSRVYRGASSLHSHTESMYQPAWQRGHILGGVSSGELWARYYMNISGATSPSSIAGLHLLGEVAPYDGVIWGATPSRVDISATETGTNNVFAIPVPTDRWLCVEVHVVIDPAAGLVETWLDGTPTARLDNLDTLPPNGYWNVHTGHFAGNPNTNPIDVWTDELVVSTTRVPCD